jgi:hypothetical protein
MNSFHLEDLVSPVGAETFSSIRVLKPEGVV